MRFASVCLSVALLATPLAAEGAGFYLQEQSVRAQGSAFAGAGSYAADASGIFFNPAIMTRLEGRTGTAALVILTPRSEYRDRGSAAGLFGGGQAAYAGGGSGNPFKAEFLPALYAAAPMDGEKRFWLGLGAGAPFGLENDYGRGWAGRYDSTKSELAVYNVSPVVAFKLNDSVSVGGGPDFQFARGLLESALPCPAVGFGCGAVFSPASDGLSQLKGDGRSVGFNAGASFDLGDLDAGVHYRSAGSTVIKGRATVAGLAGGLAAFNGSRAATAKLKLPDILSFSAAYDASPRLKLLASYNRYGWGNFDEIRIRLDGGAVPDNVTPENYRDTSGYALGAEWRHSDAWSFRGGVQYDETPTTAPDRSSRTPDSDRFWIAAGFSYAFNDTVSVDAAAAHIFMKDAVVAPLKRIYAGTAADTSVQVNGVAENSVSLFSVQGVWRF